MKFEKNTRRSALEYEKDLVSYWKENKIFEKSVESRSKDNTYVFYDGPPFITGIPHHGTLLSSIVKDAIPRFWTMKGRRVERVWGWDCHGLPAEIFTEKKLGIRDKRDIGTKVSLAEYIKTCRENMVQTGNEWEDTIERVGRWVDFQGAYKTMDKDYMESVWWAFKQLYDAGKVYEGEKVLLYCVRDATPISKAEVAMDNSYKDITDPSVYVKFKLKGTDSYLLAWTTTPWTLPANVAVAVNQNFIYSEVEVDNVKLILAEKLLEKVLTDEKHRLLDYKVLRSFSGKELVGKETEPLFEDRGSKAHRIFSEDYVNLDEGTGIVHLAPAYGEEDFAMAQKVDLPILSIIDENGYYTSGKWKGEYVWNMNKIIAKELQKQSIVWKIEYIVHSYPHCHRCGTRLMYRAHPSWFVDIESQRESMLENNADITWFPGHIKKGRFTKTVQSAPDWNLSRDRFWATAIPVWKGIDVDGKEKIKVVGSYAELKELAGIELEDYHRPWIDEVTFTIAGIEYKRIDKVFDSWFESGSMPFAQFHYPFENVEKFELNFPGDFIAEYVGQVRAWFYYLHAVSTGLFSKNAFKNVIVTGTLAGNDGRKMSKSYGNYTDPNELMDKYSADSLRYLLLSSPVLNAEDFSLQDKDVSDVARKLAMIWNMYDFFCLYADVDAWDSKYANGKLPPDPSSELDNPLDQWIVSKVHLLGSEVNEHMLKYDIPNALKPILPFIDDASNWYVRRSRKRFWKSDNDADKNNAYKTLHYVLVRLSLILAPFTPFLSEELYRKLTGGESVHLLSWPEPGVVNETVLQEMLVTREVIAMGLASRAEAGIKVRQPLASAEIFNVYDIGLTQKILKEYTEIVAEELNVKEVIVSDDNTNKVKTTLDTEITYPLMQEGLMRELIRNIQQARKRAGLQIDDRILLSIGTKDDEITSVLKNDLLSKTIRQETLTQQYVDKLENCHLLEAKIGTAILEIRIQKA
jgi:isoleucyl-tRNA synthetase